MKSLIFLLFFVRLISAFGDAARNERLFYYYTYLIDAALNPTTGPQTIAANCGKFMGIGAKNACSFNDFNKYIYGNDPVKNPPPDGWDVTSEKYPSYSDLNGDHGLSGLYTENRIIQNAPDVETILKGCTAFAKKYISSLPDGAAKDSIKSGLFTAIQGVARSRMENKVNDLQKDFKDGYTWEDESGSHTVKANFALTPIPLYDGAPAGETVNTLDIPGTLRDNPGLQRKDLIAGIQANDRNGAPGHNENIKAARQGAQYMAPYCQ